MWIYKDDAFIKNNEKIFAYDQFDVNILLTNQSLRKELHMATKKKTAKKKTAKKK
jgi:hypothetical protein